MNVLRRAARPMLASMFVVGGVDSLRNATQKAPIADPVAPAVARAVNRLPVPVTMPTDPETLVRINAGTHLVAGLALAVGRMPRLASTVLAASLLPTTAAAHRFWTFDDPAVRQAQQVHFFKNVSLCGGLLITALDTEGRESRGRQVRRAATGAARSARSARRQTRRRAGQRIPGV